MQLKQKLKKNIETPIDQTRDLSHEIMITLKKTNQNKL
jgi:hypothetical protein